MRNKKLLITLSSFRKIHKFNHLSFEVGSSNLQWHRCSHAAACVPSDTYSRKSGPRVPKHERRAMVESFVNKYRSENAGKFPGIKYTQKEVGGSYYTVRDIIQELEYKSKMKSLNSTDEILVEKLFDESKLKTAESVSVSSGNIDTAKDRPIQDVSQSILLDDKEAVNTGCELLEEKRGPQTSSWEGRLSNEVETISTPDNHCITSESNILEKHLKEPSCLQMPNDVKTEETVSSFSDSVELESQLLQLEVEHFSRGHGSEFVDRENHKKMEDCNKKASYERREQPSLEDMYGEASHSSSEAANDVKSDEAVSSCPSDYVAPEIHSLKEEIKQVSAPIIEKSGSSCSKDQIHDSKSVDINSHPTIEIKSFEKAGLERKVQDGAQDLPGVDSPKHKKEKSQGSLKLDESKIDSSNKRESSVAVASEKSTLWGNLKSFADGVLNIWRKL